MSEIAILRQRTTKRGCEYSLWAFSEIERARYCPLGSSNVRRWILGSFTSAPGRCLRRNRSTSRTIWLERATFFRKRGYRASIACNPSSNCWWEPGMPVGESPAQVMRPLLLPRAWVAASICPCVPISR
jgi:hypothetical protein